MGYSVTQRIKNVKQPRGGYINPKQFEQIQLFDDVRDLHENENVSAVLIGIAVDYLTRFNDGLNKREAFKISLQGAANIGEVEQAEALLSEVNGLDDQSVINAIKLAGFDVVFRVGPMFYKPVSDIEPDTDTVENVQIMVSRARYFFSEYGPTVLDGFTFSGGDTETVSSGDGDFTTSDTLWDFKVTGNKITKNHTLQLIMYWIMGLHSIHEEFHDIKYVGIFNPRLNVVYRLAVNQVPEEVIAEIETDVIGYKKLL